ncbi:hypothetical protein BDV10DRAFT_189055 [Aspergillus recurvatus]
MFGWAVREWWDLYASVLPPESTPKKRGEAIAREVNKDRFFGPLVATDEPVFLGYAVNVLDTFREALEAPWMYRHRCEPLEAWIPAAADWIEALGPQTYEWEEEECRPGARGRKGPLWSGKNGFSKERWRFWRGSLQRLPGWRTSLKR